MELAIILSIFMALFCLICIAFSYIDIQTGKAKMARNSRTKNMYYREGAQRVKSNKRRLRLFLLGLVLSPFAIVIVPTAAILAFLWGVWTVVRLAFERDEPDEPVETETVLIKRSVPRHGRRFRI